MFDQLLLLADEASVISELLPPLIKAGAFVVIALIAAVPLMLTAWLVTWASAPAIIRAKETLASWGAELGSSASQFFIKARGALKVLDKQSGFIPLSEPLAAAAPPELIAVEEARDALKNRLDRAPTLAENSEATKQNTIAELNNVIDDLSKERDLVRTPRIPKVSEDDATAKLRKKEAFTALIIFIPLTVVAIVINTALLDVFFADIFGRKEVLSLPYSIIISFVFSVIEAGVGIVLGFVGSNETRKAGAPITVFICWTVILSLVLIEAALYFLVGTNVIGQLDLDEASLMIADGEIINLFLLGAWFTLIGPAVVLSLYLFGHKLSESYFKYTRYTSFDDFRKSMDKGHEISQSFLENIKRGESTVEGILAKIKDQEITLNNVKDELPAKVTEYSKQISEELKNFDEAIGAAQKIEVTAPEVLVQRLDSNQNSDLLKISGFYLLVFLLAIVLGTWAFPTANIPFLPNHLMGAFILASFISLFSMISGFLCSPKITVVRTGEGDTASIVVEKRGVLVLITTVSTVLALSGLYWFIFSGTEAPGLRASLAVVINIACFFVGTRLQASFTAWSALIAFFSKLLAGGILLLCKGFTRAISTVIDIANSILIVFATPAISLFGKKGKEPK